MGKRKRLDKDYDVVEKLYKKVKKLAKKKRRLSSSSEEVSIASPAPAPLSNNNLCASDLEIEDEIPLLEQQSHNTELMATSDVLELQHTADTNDGVVETNVEDLGDEELELLGPDYTETKCFGDDLHKNLAPRWKHILTNGLPKSEKTDLLKLYLPAQNCTNMKAPVLNPEIKTALSEINVKKDAYSEEKQNQMSSCIAAIGKALNHAFLIKPRPQAIIKTLGDAARLLCDTHYRESQSRRYAIINVLSKQKRDIIKNTKIDDQLFGSNLTEHLRASRAISASATELRIANNRLSEAQRTQPGTSFSRYPRALNARGAPRAQAAEPRAYPPAPTRRLPPPPPPAPRNYRQQLTAPAAHPRTANY